MVKAVWVNADHGRDLHHMSKLRNLTKEKKIDFSAFRISPQ